MDIHHVINIKLISRNAHIWTEIHMTLKCFLSRMKKLGFLQFIISRTGCDRVVVANIISTPTS